MTHERKRHSVATELALQLIREGMTPYRAAKTAGIALSTIYRHTQRIRLEQVVKEPANTTTIKELKP